MFDQIETIRMAQAMGQHAAARNRVAAANVANADTPGYRAQDMRPFAASYRNAAANPMRATRPGHLDGSDRRGTDLRPLDAPGAQSPNGNSVSLEEEMFRSAEIRRQHEVSLAVYRSSLDLLQSAIGKRR
ncbi:flagellar basal-body rod protein FlgB [Paracoccus isoporae]|uniref:Flagellar basal body rod protein FlgB n=1 Tax=Paracoccus isoporae TaxID=591205 RepID=A0A1G7CWR1_9RHOB|nr:FlgB family protein [Paracoccus isoporae]SDE43739.1 flagellar basal-body rod protein FlgB [Paracoccus isoporae]